MISCIQIETASLVFACLSLLLTSLGSLGCIAFLEHINVLMINLMIGKGGKLSTDYVTFITRFEVLLQAYLAFILSILAVSLVFSIILTKGLLSKKAHLVKAYFVYGVTANTLFMLTHLSLIATQIIDIISGLLGVFGFFLYSLILAMIKKTYHKLESTDCDQFCHKKLEAEKSNA